MKKEPRIPMLIDSRHPNYFSSYTDWEKYRLTYAGGPEFRDRYLVKFDTREDNDDFKTRRSITPIPAYAKSAVNDIRNSIFQRLTDVVRKDGSNNYQRAVMGENGGVDRLGSTMNYFLGNQPLTDLLVMGKVGIYVDMPAAYGETLAETQGTRPYLYYYQIEDILNYSMRHPGDSRLPGEFSSVLLRDTVIEYDRTYWMPSQVVKRYRHMWLDEQTGRVMVQFYNHDGDLIDAAGEPGGAIELEIKRIPFVLLDIGDSLLKDVADHQIALMNLCSSDVNYALRSNFPFYTEQRDSRAVGQHLKHANSDGTASSGGQGAGDSVQKVGVTQGRYYDLNAERPGFIAPPAEPLRVSLELQRKLEEDVRKIINLAVRNLGTRTSAESKAMDNQGLDAGLSYIGLVLEGAEKKIADYWAAYEERVESRRRIASIKYPDRYSLKTDIDRIEEAGSLASLMFKVPGQTVKKEFAKNIVSVLFSGKVKVEVLDKIMTEIDDAPYATSDPTTISEAKKLGLVSDRVASMAFGFDENEYITAQEDHLNRVRRLMEAQGVTNNGTDPGARGIPDLSANPIAGSEERQSARDSDQTDNGQERVRGEGAN